MTINIEKQYRTAHGLNVDLLRHYPDNGKWIGVVFGRDGTVMPASWDENGHSHEGVTYMLVEVQPRIERELWLNLYEDHDTVHASKWQADHADFHYQKERINPRLACVSVSVDCEVGAGLEV